MSEKRFWHLTLREYDAHYRLWERAHGIKPPLTEEELKNLARNQNAILRMQVAGHNKQVAEIRKRAERSGMKLVDIPVREEAHG